MRECYITDCFKPTGAREICKNAQGVWIDMRTGLPDARMNKTEIGTNIPVYIGSHRMGRNASAMVYVNGEPFASAKARLTKAPGACPDPEKLATLISIKRALAMASSFPLPPGAKALLSLAAQLLALRIEAQSKAGQAAQNAKERFQKLLESSKKSPSKLIRSFAAGFSEWLK